MTGPVHERDDSSEEGSQNEGSHDDIETNLERLKKAAMNANLVVKLSKYILRSTVGSDDLADMLNNRCTGVIMLGFVGLLFVKQYVLKPIQCWVPQEFNKPWEEYAEYYCWVSDTYFVPVSDPLPVSTHDRMQRRLVYYQWVPFVLMLQLLAFYIPYIVWQVFSSHSGMHVHGVLQCADECAGTDSEHRERIVLYMARYLEECFARNRKGKRGPLEPILKFLSMYLPCLVFGKHLGNYLSSLYLIVKILYISNLLGQIYLIGIFTQRNYTLYGVEILMDISKGYPYHWQKSGLFPRVTWCDLEVWTLGAVHRYSIQCVLPINLFNEKIYIFLWFWFILVLVLTIISLIQWTVKLTFSGRRHSFIGKYISLNGTMTRGDRNLSKKFVEGVLRNDGILIIAMISQRAGDMVAGDIVCHMFHWYKDRVNRSNTGGGEMPYGRSPRVHNDGDGGKGEV